MFRVTVRQSQITPHNSTIFNCLKKELQFVVESHALIVVESESSFSGDHVSEDFEQSMDSVEPHGKPEEEEGRCEQTETTKFSDPYVM